jgi:ribonuclease G
MQNEIIINADSGETRIALLERSTFVELHIERDGGRSVVGSVVKGTVTRVLPGMQAAFVDIGLEKAAFLYVGDYFANTGSTGENGEADAVTTAPRRGRGRGPNRQPPKIETVLSEGQEIVVQIAKAPIGTKGARITSHISIPGRHLVLTPWARRVGVSRRIDVDRERKRLREIVDRLRPKDLGFIIRTAGDGLREADLKADIRYLTTIWEKIQTGHREAPAPQVLYAEPGLALRMVRDFAGTDTKRIAIDSAEVYESIKDFVDRFVADPKPKLEHYSGPVPIFDGFDLESRIHANLERKVWLKSGGSLIIDQSEALTAIDVNTGRYVGTRDLEETVFRTNLEAIKEIVYQLRFRNIGGLIIIDLIDMEAAENREKVYRALQDAVRADKARTNILKISELGLVEMTRKRTRANLVQTVCEPCSFCEGRGYVLSRQSVAFKVLREIRTDLPRFCGRRIAVTVSPQVAEQLLTAGNESLAALGADLGREIEVRARPGLYQEQFEITALDSGPPVEIPLSWLAERKPEPEPQEKRSKQGARGRSRSQPKETDTPGEQEAQEPQEQKREDEVAAEASQPNGGAAEGVIPEAEDVPAAEPGAPEIPDEGEAQPETAEIPDDDRAQPETREPAAAAGEPEAAVEAGAAVREEAAPEVTKAREELAGDGDTTAGEAESAGTVTIAETPVTPDDDSEAAESDRSESAAPGPASDELPAPEPEPLPLAERILAHATTLDESPPRVRRRRGARRRPTTAAEEAAGDDDRGQAPQEPPERGAATTQPLDAATESRILPASRGHEES